VLECVREFNSCYMMWCYYVTQPSMTRKKIRRKHSFDYLFENLGEEVSSRSEQSIYDLVASVWSGLSYRRESASDCIPHTRRLKSIFLARSGSNKTSGTMHHAVQSLAEGWNSRLDCSRFNTLWSYVNVSQRMYFIVSSWKFFIEQIRSEFF